MASTHGKKTIQPKARATAYQEHQSHTIHNYVGTSSNFKSVRIWRDWTSFSIFRKWYTISNWFRQASGWGGGLIRFLVRWRALPHDTIGTDDMHPLVRTRLTLLQRCLLNPKSADAAYSARQTEGILNLIFNSIKVTIQHELNWWNRVSIVKDSANKSEAYTSYSVVWYTKKWCMDLVVRTR